MGYSFSMADDYIFKMLLKAISQDPSKTVIIIDKRESTIENFKQIVKRHVSGFKEKNLYDLVGAGEEIVPKALEILNYS